MLAFIETRVRSFHPVLLVFALLAIAFLKAGVWPIPNSNYLEQLAENPFVNPYTGIAQYLFSNWLTPFLAWLIHARSVTLFTLFNAAMSGIFFVINFASLYRSLSEPEWRKSVCLFMCLPVAWTHLYWIGYDSLTLALLAAILAARCWPWLTFVFGVGVGLQHFSQGVIALTFLVFVSVTRGKTFSARTEIVSFSAALVGTFGGWCLLQSIIWHYDIHLDYDRSAYLRDNLHEIVGNNLQTFTTFLYCLLGPAWLIFFDATGLHRAKLLLLIVLMFSTIVTFMTDDVTRVFAVLSYPAIAFCLLYNREWLSDKRFNHVSFVLGIWIITPWLFDWAGVLRTTLFIADVKAAVYHAVGWPAPAYPSILSR